MMWCPREREQKGFDHRPSYLGTENHVDMIGLQTKRRISVLAISSHYANWQLQAVYLNKQVDQWLKKKFTPVK